jgi:hypothetical protein
MDKSLKSSGEVAPKKERSSFLEFFAQKKGMGLKEMTLTSFQSLKPISLS